MKAERPGVGTGAGMQRICSGGHLGIQGYTVEVHATCEPGALSLTVAGLPKSAVKETWIRVRAALDNSGYPLSQRHYTVYLLPADVRRDAAALDLPIALALLGAVGEENGRGGRDTPTQTSAIHLPSLSGLMFLGELGLDGSIRRVVGTLPVALHAKRAGFRGLVLPRSCAAEATAVRDLPIYPVSTLRETVAVLRGERDFGPPPPAPAAGDAGAQLDLLDVRGNEHPKRALEVAAAGGHNLLLIGPPGTGKSMLARRLPGILPPLSEAEAIEATSIYSAAGLLRGAPLLSGRPFRAPHHDVSVPGLVGGGGLPRPGEISLAHHGVLFLDELPEFRRVALEALRQPLENRQITIVRAKTAVTYPAAFALVAAMNPCPCGYRGSRVRRCSCDVGQVLRYRVRISGPLLDRFDLHVEVPHVEYSTLLWQEREGEGSATVRARVDRARQVQLERHRTLGLTCANVDLSAEQLLVVARPQAKGEELLMRCAEKHLLSSRAVHRVLRVARTIADLGESEAVGPAHIAEALTFRTMDHAEA